MRTRSQSPSARWRERRTRCGESDRCLPFRRNPQRQHRERREPMLAHVIAGDVRKSRIQMRPGRGQRSCTTRVRLTPTIRRAIASTTRGSDSIHPGARSCRRCGRSLPLARTASTAGRQRDRGRKRSNPFGELEIGTATGACTPPRSAPTKGSRRRPAPTPGSRDRRRTSRWPFGSRSSLPKSAVAHGVRVFERERQRERGVEMGADANRIRRLRQKNAKALDELARPAAAAYGSSACHPCVSCRASSAASISSHAQP